MGLKLICSTQTRPDLRLPFMPGNLQTRRYQEHFILLAPCSSTYNAASWATFFPGHWRHHFRDGPGQGKVWSSALTVRVCAALSRWPVSFLCLHHKAFRDHSCPFCGHFCVNFYSIYLFTSH